MNTARRQTARQFSGHARVGLFVVAALLLYFLRLEVPGQYIYDEVYHAYTAGQYVVGNADAYLWNTQAPREGVAYTWNHPPAGLLLLASGIALWGDTPYGWRFSSAIFGAIGIAVTYLLTLRLTRDRGVAELASGLLLMDGLYFVQSRTAMLDIFGTVFMMGAFLCLYGYLTSPPHRVSWPLVGTGAFLGLAIATKWNAAYPAALIGILVLWRVYRLWRPTRATPLHGRGVRDAGAGLREHLVWIPIGLIVVPLAVYLAAYIPFFLTGHSFSQFIELQTQIYYYHTHLQERHGYESSWWQWPLVLRPVWYHGGYAPGATANVYAQGNPVLYWAFVPAVLWLSLRWWRSRDPALLVLLIGFFGQWLPWALVPRIAFLYHFLPAVPFGTLAVASAVSELWQGGTHRRTIAAGYVAAVALAFIFFHPLYAAVPLTQPALETRMWFKSWR